MGGNKVPKQAEPQSQESRKRKSSRRDSDDFTQGSNEKHRSTRSPWNSRQTQQSIVFQDDVHRSEDLPSNIELCHRCRAIDLDEINSLSLGDLECIPIQNLGRMTDADRDSSCPLCKLLWTLRPGNSEVEKFIDKYQNNPDSWLAHVSWAKVEQNGAGPKLDGFALAVLPSKPRWKSESWKLGVNHRHHVVSTGYLGQPLEGNSMSSSFHLRYVKPTSINYPIIKEWLGFCASYHQEFCIPFNSGLGNSFRLIHCKTRRVVSIATSTSVVPHFLALSYVWGAQVDHEQDKTLRDYLPKGCPSTIEDSLTVTLELGFDYLWIDRYCIWQDDEEDKHAQIRLMAEIYGSAQATIIAAAGSDPEYGLPGVGKRPRIPQPEVKLGRHALCWTMESSKSLLQNSVWITRAWTFQEALLSQRRLIFTDRQVYFECSVMNCCEAKNEPHRFGPSLKEWDKLHSITRSARYSFPKLRTGLPWEIVHIIRQYTERSISKQSDILNGFQGILRVYEELDPPVYNILGVPMLPAVSEWASQHHMSPSRTRLSSFLTHLCWDLVEPGTRRCGFPSWSWAGWKGHFSNFYIGTHLSIGWEFDITISFEAVKGGTISWDEIEASLGSTSLQKTLSGTIVIECWTMKIELMHKEQVPKNCVQPYPDKGFYVRYGKDKSIGYEIFHTLKRIETHADWVQELQKCPLTGLFIGRLRGQRQKKGDLMQHSPWVLVCAQVGNVWERIGHFWLWKKLNGESGEIERFNEGLGLVRREIRLA